jgi:DNA-directed RNA polymerase subunit E'/Rpb7
MEKYFKTSIITKRCMIPIYELSNNIQQTILNILKTEFEGKCSNEGYIQKNSINIIEHSIGIANENHIIYDATFEASVCYPVEDQIINCRIDNITKAGVKAVLSETDNPIVVFAARDLHLDNDEFNSLTIGDQINVSIIGTRFEIYDQYISAIAKFINKT